MSQPVKLSDALVLDARVVGGIAERSIAGQIEFWANLGRAIEPVLDGARVLALARSGRVRPLSKCLANVDSPGGRRRVSEYLVTIPYPHYEPASRATGVVEKIDANGRRTLGRFVRRRFEPLRSGRA
ncbi:MAG: hypothetical protein NTV05_08275 [Acidobacteria bacterium]|nr:hypothetical protein [Acidobacteriota bacterium]